MERAAGIKPRLSTLLMSVLVLGGCVSVPKYPEHWAAGFPKQKPFGKADETCPSIAGSYSDAGESSPDDGSHATVSLWRTLFAGRALQDDVTIRDSEGGTLQMVAWKDGKPIAQRTLVFQKTAVSGCNKSDGCYRCLNGLTYATVPSKNSCVPAIACSNDNFLYRGQDGWLVLKRNEFKFYDFVFPWWGTWKTRWYRFRPLPSMTDAP